MTAAASAPPRHSARTSGPCCPGAPVHRVASLAKRWLLPTHQGRGEAEHLPSYADEFCFRFNRGRSHSRGLVFPRVLQLKVWPTPVRHKVLIRPPRLRAVALLPPTVGQRHSAHYDVRLRAALSCRGLPDRLVTFAAVVRFSSDVSSTCPRKGVRALRYRPHAARRDGHRQLHRWHR